LTGRVQPVQYDPRPSGVSGFLWCLTDIPTALATDVTAAGVKAIEGAVSSANWNRQYVGRAARAALKEMTSLSDGALPGIEVIAGRNRAQGVASSGRS
jgi:hypothetical protein